MTDLYLVLRSRLDAVPEWVYIDTDILKTARESRGLSYETMARTVPVSAKTWERYEKAGRVPRPVLPGVAATLGLEIEEPAVRRITVDGRAVDAETSFELGELRRLLERIDRKIDQLDLANKFAGIEERIRDVMAEVKHKH